MRFFEDVYEGKKMKPLSTLISMLTLYNHKIYLE